MRWFWPGLVLSLALGTGGATAAPLVYHSPGNTGKMPGYVPYLPNQSSVTLHLWLDPGSQPITGTVCNNATGDASCAFDVRVQVFGGPQLLSFVPTEGTCTIGCNLTPTMLRVNQIPSIALVGRKKIGTLTVRTNLPQGGSIEVMGVHSVGAARQLQNIPRLPIAYVPEPGMLVLLFSGLAGLAVLNRLRGSR